MTPRWPTCYAAATPGPSADAEAEAEVTIESYSARARIADDGEGITREELQLAARNHGLPLEALAFDVTPVGLHYLLVHYDIPVLEGDSWAVTVTGRVGSPLRVDLAGLSTMPSHTVRATLECAGNGRALLTPRPISQPWLVEAVGTADWTGVLLADLLELAGVLPDAVDVVFTGADRGVERGVVQDYRRGLPLAEARAAEVLIAYEMNGAPLPPQHGFPARLIVPGWYGMAHVKWLTGIEVIDHTFGGFQNAVAYRLRRQPGEVGEDVTRIEPRALLIPPGFPDFMSRRRFVEAGAVTLSGRAWSGWSPVDRVEVSLDAGMTWRTAELDEVHGRWAWRGFHLRWDAEPGEYTLTARAIDGSGRVQPTDAEWNRGGFANNSGQRVAVLVLPR
jgi:sulfite dehydrogenase